LETLSSRERAREADVRLRAVSAAIFPKLENQIRTLPTKSFWRRKSAEKLPEFSGMALCSPKYYIQ
jgi:hypothetical protein